ncbi:MAG: M14 family zinc carboxypeptidase [Bacteroidota bacterium]
MIAFEKNPNQTATYEEAITFYQSLADQYPQLQLSRHGATDSGFPLHTAVLSTDRDFDPVSVRKKGKQILMINNAIHPGEPCGVDASMMLIRDYLSNEEWQNRLRQLVIVVIPFYNIGGGLNRSSYSRANQDGPEAYGFRGNARNLDLNRDFIKCDSKNAQTFNQIFTFWNPDVFIDNHTSNGADYQYTMTLIATQHNKMEQALGTYLNEKLLPNLYQEMEKRDWEMIPYVYARDIPDNGIQAFLDLPRYSSGYAALFNTISFMPETHMLKPFKDRVLSTYHFMDVMIHEMQENGEQLAAARQAAIEQTKNKERFALQWKLDETKVDRLSFKGYEAKYKKSEVSGLDRLYYDHSAPFEKEIDYLNTYKATLSVDKPRAYIIPQAYQAVIDRLSWNGVKYQRLTADQNIEVEMYRIEDYESTNFPYEGHYLHSDVKLKKELHTWRYHKGDYIVFVDQPVNRYIIETLEPQSPDAYFAWNFFDGILMQKEYFSSYVFEDLAAEFLKQNPDVQAALEAKKKEDEKFAQSARAQLNFVYKRSPYYEPTHSLYPVGRMLKEQSLELD